MSVTWVCSVCGCNSNHVSRTKGCLVCDSCGTEVRSEAEKQEELNYQRNMVLAKNHLKVGNWEEAKRIVKPYANSRPSDKQVYLYLLVATTKCFEDFLLDNPAANEEAEIYWDKLRRLGCVNSAMIKYSQRRAAKLRAIHDEVTIKKTVIIVINLVLTVMAGLLVACGEGIAIVFIILTIVGWTHGTKWIGRNKGV